ncbi:MAG: hypothetical protein IKC10_03940 [Alphaproteobacteria bacterium]|nr:hypothetical protein [Alphaproteobacteria bacterium]
MAINFNQPKSISTYNTEDIKNYFYNNNISVFLDSAFERGRIDKKEYAFLLDFLSTHNPHELTTHDIYNLPNDNIYSIQKYFDEYNIAYIEAAYKQGIINDNEFKSLYKIYNDGMTYYSQVYDLFLELFGDPKEINGLNLADGNISPDSPEIFIDQDVRVLTPFVETRIKFKDKAGNSIYVIFPKIKAAHRAIDKLTKEIGKNINKELATSFDEYLNCEDRERFSEICEKPLKKTKDKTIELHDITRLTITRKYLSGVAHTTSLINKYEKEYNYTTSSPRDRFNMPLYENGKLYFDSKIIITLLDDNNKPFDVEIELKIDTLRHADKRTHDNYDKYRKIIESISENDPNRAIKEAQADELEKQNREINANATHEYNMIVIDKVQRKINTNLKHRRRKKINSDDTYTECNELIFDRYLVDSYEAFDPDKSFNPEHYTNGKPINKMCFLKLVGLLPKTFDEFAPGSDKIIEETFNSIYDKSNQEKYQKFHPIRSRYREILEASRTYSNTINTKIVDKIVNDFAEAHTSFIFDEKTAENLVKNNDISVYDSQKIEKDTKKYLSFIPDQLQNFDVQDSMGKICVLKMLRRLPKNFPQRHKDIKGKDLQSAQQIYTDIFSNPKDKDHALLSRLLKIATNKKDEIRKLSDEKLKNKISQTVSTCKSQADNKSSSISVVQIAAKNKLQKN